MLASRRMSAAITTRGLRRCFGDVVALDGLELDVRRGEVFGLLGHNGAGKTTTVRLLNGLLNPDDGMAAVLGMDPWRQGAELRSRTGVLTEVAAHDKRLDARETLRYHGRVLGLDRLRERVEAELEHFGITPFAHLRVGGYSKGMAQRLALARAFLGEPELLFLDEPIAALDPVAAAQVHAHIRAHADKGHTVLLCTHNLTEAEKLCDRVAVMENGRVRTVGTPSELGATGGTLLEVEDGEAAVAALAAAGIEVRSQRPARRSLEEVYRALHEEEP